jgi:hypothetical protein
MEIIECKLNYIIYLDPTRTPIDPWQESYPIPVLKAF